jgi:hypothetical protein
MQSLLAANLENLLFLLLVAVAVLFQILAKAVAKASKDQTKRTSTPQTHPPTPRAPRESGEDQIRKLLEALGHPPTSTPPPPVARRTDTSPRPLAPVQPPISPLQQLSREKRRKREAIPPPPAVTPTKEISPPKVAVASVFEVQEGPVPIESPPIVKAPAEAYTEVARTITKTKVARTDIVTLLASTSGLRDAMILREIVGPPRGLQAIDLL